MTSDFSEGQKNLYLTTPEAAHLLRYSPRTLETLRRTGDGPPFIRLAPNKVVYGVDDIVAWMESRKVFSTSDPGQQAA